MLCLIGSQLPAWAGLGGWALADLVTSPGAAVSAQEGGPRPRVEAGSRAELPQAGSSRRLPGLPEGKEAQPSLLPREPPQLPIVRRQLPGGRPAPFLRTLGPPGSGNAGTIPGEQSTHTVEDPQPRLLHTQQVHGCAVHVPTAALPRAPTARWQWGPVRAQGPGGQRSAESTQTRRDESPQRAGPRSHVGRSRGLSPSGSTPISYLTSESRTVLPEAP